MTDFKTYLPRWTKRAVLDGSGRDPLGLSRVSDQFPDYLLPSIITTTNRARYYSFYPWALRDSVEALEEKDYLSGFETEFRKREAAFAIASKLGKRFDASIVGIDQVNKYLDGVDDDDSIDVTFKVLPGDNWGGFGQYYGGCLRNLGLGNWTEDGIWEVTSDRGKKLAEAFERSIRRTAYFKKACSGMDRVPKKILQDSCEDFSLDGILGDHAKEERELLTHILFDLDEDSNDYASEFRRATLGQLLHVIGKCQEIGSPTTRRVVSARCLYLPHYYGSLYESNNRCLSYEAHPAFQRSSSHWRQFCAHQFFSYAVEECLQSMLDAVSIRPEGLTKSELVQELQATGFVEELEQVTGKSLPMPSDLMRYFGAGKDPEKAQTKFSANHPLAEFWIYSRESKKPISARLGRTFAILTQLHAKWSQSDDAALASIGPRVGSEWWLGTGLLWGDQWMEHKMDWNSALSVLIDDVHSHHETIRFQKHKLDASWLEKIGDRYTKLQDLKPDFRADRHENAVMILQDLGILEPGGRDSELNLTSWGRQILKQVIKRSS